MRRPEPHSPIIHIELHPDPVVEQLLRDIRSRTHHISERLTQMATQADVDTLTATLNDAVTSIQAEADQLGTALQQIQDEIAALQNSNPTVDLTGLQSAVDGVSSATASLQAAADSVEAIPPAPVV